jgi:hypothetical protein
MTITAEPVAPSEEPTPVDAGGGPSRWFVAGVLLCVLVGFGIRWANIAVVRPVCQPPGADSDPDCYDLYIGANDPLYGHLQGRLIAEGHWFVNPYVALSDGQDAAVTGPDQASVGDPPLYQLFLGGLSAAGIESGQAHRHASAVVGLATIPLLALLARRLAGDAAGVLAGFVAAVHPLLWINDAMLLSEALYAPLIAGVLLAAVAFRDRPSVRGVVALSVLVTLAAFTRGEAILLLPALVPPVVLGARSVPWRDRTGMVAIAAAVAGALLLPWNLWLNSRFEEQVFMTSASGSVLSASACDQHFYGDPLALFIYCAVDVDLPAGLDESQRDARVRAAAVEYLRANADRYPVVAAVRVARMWDLYGPADNLAMNIGVEARGDFASNAGLAVHYGLLPFATVGFIALWRRGEQVWPYVAVALMVSSTAALTFGLTRYRVPADVAIIALAAVGVDAIGRAWRNPSARP